MITLFGKPVDPKLAGVLGGAVAGFFVGGPAGAAIGAIAGYGGGAYVAERTGFVTYQPFNRFTATRITNAIVPGTAPVATNNPGGQKVTALQIALKGSSSAAPGTNPSNILGTNPPATAIITLSPVSIDVSNAGRYIGIVRSGPATANSQLDFQASEVMAMGSPDPSGTDPSQLVWDQGDV
jgi:hypothetical protein